MLRSLLRHAVAVGVSFAISLWLVGSYWVMGCATSDIPKEECAFERVWPTLFLFSMIVVYGTWGFVWVIKYGSKSLKGSGK
jgi:hypothetical protein